MFTEIRERDVETVIPKDKSEEVVVLRGRNRGEVGRIIEKNKAKELVVV